MNIYQHDETGRIYEGYASPSARYAKIGQVCDKCGALNREWETSNYCQPCREITAETQAAIRSEGRFSDL